MYSNTSCSFRLLLAVSVMATGLSVFAQDEPRGRVVTTTLTSPALERNALGDSATRNARVYLPPSYETSSKRYPVAYYLHGGSGGENSLFNLSGHRTADELIRDGLMAEMILVGVDGTNSYGAPRFVNSDVHGNHEDYIVQDVVNHIDANFRTIRSRDARGLFGASAGGAAAMLYAMLHADVYGAVYTLSSGVGGFSQPDTLLYLGDDVADFSNVFLAAAGTNDPGNHLDAVNTRSDINSSLRRTVFGWAAGYSPNLADPVLLVDLPFELPSLQVIPEVRDRWYEFDPFQVLAEHTADITSLRGFAMDVGNSDALGLNRDNELFHQALLDAGVPHEFDIYSGGHSDKRAERIAEALVFLSESLVVPLQAGDADQDRDFDQLDLVQVQIAGKYLSGKSATWGEGDWNGAPGGFPSNPPEGDGLFNQLDIVAAQQAATYLTGTYAAVAPNDRRGESQTSIAYDADTGELTVDVPSGIVRTSINIDSSVGNFTGEAAPNPGDSFGNVAATGLSEEFVTGDLTVVGSLAGGGDLGAVDLVYVPEPMSATLLTVGVFSGLLLHFRRPCC